jgi:hypothetical protein
MLHLLAPSLEPLGTTRRAETSGLAGEHKQMFRAAGRAVDLGKPATRLAAVQRALDDLYFFLSLTSLHIAFYHP